MVNTSTDTREFSNTSIQTTADMLLRNPHGNYPNPEDRFIAENRPTLNSQMPSVSDFKAIEEDKFITPPSNGITHTSNGVRSVYNSPTKSYNTTNNNIPEKQVASKQPNGLVKSVLSFTLLLTVLSVFVVASFEVINF